MYTNCLPLVPTDVAIWDVVFITSAIPSFLPPSTRRRSDVGLCLRLRYLQVKWMENFTQRDPSTSKQSGWNSWIRNRNIFSTMFVCLWVFICSKCCTALNEIGSWKFLKFHAMRHIILICLKFHAFDRDYSILSSVCTPSYDIHAKLKGNYQNNTGLQTVSMWRHECDTRSLCHNSMS